MVLWHIRIKYYSCVRRAFVPVALLTLALTGCYSGSRPPRIGTNAPDFTVQDADHKVSLNDLRGKVVVLNFWATWCPPCIEEMPSLVQMQQHLKGKGVEVLAVSIDVDESVYHKFLKDHGVDLLTVRDPDQKSSNLYGTYKWPETYIIDAKGKVLHKLAEPADWMDPKMTQLIDGLL